MLEGATKVSKKLLVESPNGDMLYYLSKSEFQRQTGLWAKTILKKLQKIYRIMDTKPGNNK